MTPATDRELLLAALQDLIQAAKHSTCDTPTILRARGAAERATKSGPPPSEASYMLRTLIADMKAARDANSGCEPSLSAFNLAVDRVIEYAELERRERLAEQFPRWSFEMPEPTPDDPDGKAFLP